MSSQARGADMVEAELEESHGHLSQQSIDSEFGSPPPDSSTIDDRSHGDGDGSSSSSHPPLHQTLPDDSPQIQGEHLGGDNCRRGGSCRSQRDSQSSSVDTPAKGSSNRSNRTDEAKEDSMKNSSERERLFQSPCPSGGSVSQSSRIQRKDIHAASGDDYDDGRDDEEPMLSILNVVVDHVMVPPTPMEPEEFSVFCRQRREESKKGVREQIKLTEEKSKAGLSAADKAGGCGGMLEIYDDVEKEDDDDDDDDRAMFPLSQHSERSDQSTPGCAGLASTSQSQSFLDPPPANEKVLVPVLRFFGPVIRGDPATVRSTPRQSGCLHVHGAFPYLVARPVVAGPDGSSYRRPGDTSRASVSSQIDWDDAESVSYIVDEIHAKLEAALRATDEWKEKRDNMDGGGVNGVTENTGGKDGDCGSVSTLDSPKLPIRYIRQVTVVKGKGFYTYCSGPPAPFLRIDYYDPKSKWKVKLMLERGLDVDEAYHPDGRFYDYGGEDASTENRDKNDDDGAEDDAVGGMRQSSPPLKFRCYEAHIPYTMQVFKDLNLSGMSYIKVKRGMFRRSLPKTERRRVQSSTTGEGCKERLFFEDNVSDRFQWDSPPMIEDGPMQNETESTKTTPKTVARDGFFTATSTTDTPNRYHDATGGLAQSEPSATDAITIPSIGNTTQTTAGPCGDGAKYCPYSFVGLRPEDQFWTAKESLCDVELDARSTDLLNFRDVMTSLPEDPVERARVHWRAVPSLREIWELERRRMASLLSNEDDFLNSAPDEEEESKTAHPLTLNDVPSVPGTRLAVRGNGRLYDPSPGLEDDYRRALGDIAKRHENFMQRVDSAFKGDGPAVFPLKLQAAGLNFSTPSSQDEALAALNALGEQFRGELDEINLQSQDVAQTSQLSSISPQTPNTSSHVNAGSFRSSPLSQVAPLTQADMEEIQEAAAFGHCLERGESVLGDSVEGSSSVDPFTLTPQENEDGSDDDLFHEEEELGEEGFARSLSMLATQEALTASNEPMDEEDRNRKEEGFHDVDFDRSAESFFLSQADRAIEPIREEGDFFLSSDDDEDRYHVSSDDSICGNHDVIFTNNDVHHGSQEKYSTGMSCESKKKNEILSSNPPCTVLRRGGYILPQEPSLPPLRKHCNPKTAKGWHAIYKARGRPQPWLSLSSSYEMESGHDVPPSTLFCSDHKANVFVEPVRRPPSSRQVRTWLKTVERKGESSVRHSATNNTAKKRKSPGLVIDDNTRKLVPASAPNMSQKRRRVAFANDVVHQSSCQVFQVEEIPVEGDCKSEMSQSPYQSQSSLLSLSQDERNHEEHLFSPSQNVASTGSQGSADSSHHARGSFSAKAYSAFDPSCTMAHGEGMSTLSSDALEGIGQQGGKIHVAGGGGLKGEANFANTNHLSSAPTPLTIVSIEVHVQCRTGKAGAHDFKTIAMRPDPSRDKVAACVYLYARDPGGGEAIEILERGVLFTPVEAEIVGQAREDVDRFVRKSLGISIDRAKVEMLGSERQLLLRLASIVKYKDPDALISWDTQGGGLGYLIERGVALAKVPTAASNEDDDGNDAPKRGKEIDMVKLLGRIIRKSTIPSSLPSLPIEQQESEQNGFEWSGSGLGSDWDERVGAGAAAASIEGRLVICGWKMIAEEVKHPNSSYLPAMVATILSKRIPHHDDLILTRWYSSEGGRNRRRVLEHRLAQAGATLLLFDALDIIGRAGEAARLSGVEFSQSLPGIRGSQYKVEGCLLRALQSVWSDERGEKRGENNVKVSSTSASTQPQQSHLSRNTASLSNESSQKESPWKVQRGLVTAKVAAPPNGHHISSQQTTQSSVVDHSDRGYFFYSPSKDDCKNQEALECQAMTLEPQSGFHFDPIVVCDFTALYPSLIIAYNLCYSSCAGKLDYHSTRQEMRREGQTTGRIGPFHYAERRTASVIKHHMKSISSSKKDKDRAYVTPNGSLFVSETVVKGVLPQVLDEILATRAMLKRAAKTYKKRAKNVAPSVLRSLEAKQLALKYVANVSYGYTSATFSGRSAMPLLADAIVECGRRTLTNAIELANNWGRKEDGRWKGAHVVYGDTDSVFIKLPNRSVEEAFAFGEQFCKAVTGSNPPPVQIKLEKVYVASLLQTKKKYCGMKYESPNDKRPVFEAKGIETVRRDQCALTQKVLRNALISVFQNGLESTKEYLQRQWALIHAGRLPVSDYILTGRVRSHYRGGKIGPVQAALARRLAEADPGRTVRHKERIPYVIVAAPGLNFKLRDCVLTPTECLEQWDAYTIHAAYYIKKHVNASLQRCFGLPPFKVDVNAWYEAAPKPRKRIHHWPVTRTGSSAMITAHFGSDSCALCGAKCKAKGSSRAVVCVKCSQDKVSAAFVGMGRLNAAEQDADAVARVCAACNGCPESSSTFAIDKTPLTNDSNRGGPGRGRAPTTSSSGLGSLFRKSTAKTSTGVVTPLAACVCIDCPITYERHRLREAQIEAKALCRAIDIL